MKKNLLFLLWLVTGSAASLPAQIITRIAGGGSGSLSATGTPATSVPLNFPTGVALNSTGEVLIATNNSNYVVKVDNAGLIVHIAGTGSGFYSGDGGPATAAEVNTPTGGAADAAGNIYFADSWNQRIRKVSTSGIITTVAGNGTYGFSGDGGPATAATLADPISVTADAAGNLFIVDKGNHVIRKVNTAGIITRVAGTGTSGYNADGISALGSRLNTPEAVAVDAAGNLYIADFYNNRVRKVSTTGIISTIAGTGVYGFSGDGGPATDAQVQYPAGVAVDAAGNVYISDQNSHRIRMINTAGIITTIAGTGAPAFNGDGLNATATDPGWPLPPGGRCAGQYILPRCGKWAHSQTHAAQHYRYCPHLHGQHHIAYRYRHRWRMEQQCAGHSHRQQLHRAHRRHSCWHCSHYLPPGHHEHGTRCHHRCPASGRHYRPWLHLCG